MSHSRTENGIDYIELAMTGSAATKDFYGRAFGWTFQDWGPDYVSFSDGRVEGGFTKERSPSAPGVLLVLYSRDLAGVQQAIVAAGGRILKDTYSFPGGRRFHFADPNGNELAVWSDV